MLSVIKRTGKICNQKIYVKLKTMKYIEKIKLNKWNK